MRLKDILLGEEKSVQDLKSLLLTDFVVYDGPLYRGSNIDVDSYRILKPRTDREPVDTSPIVQEILSVIADKFFSSYPNRERSKFATSRRSNAEGYGTPYYIFPHVDSKTLFYGEDNYAKYFNDAGIYLRTAFRYGKHIEESELGKVKEEVGEKEYNLLSGVQRSYEQMSKAIPQIKSSIASFNSFSGIFDSLKEIKNKTDISLEIDDTLYYLNNFFKQLKYYFEDGKKEYDGLSDEVVIEGKYLMVNEGYLKENIGRENLWKLE